VELEFDWHERVAAPLQAVWNEVLSLEKILTNSPPAFTWDSIPGTDRASVTIVLPLGPLKWSIACQAQTEELRPAERIIFTIDGPSAELHFRGVIDVQPLGETETKLSYSATVESQHRFANRLRGLLSEILEGQVRGLVSVVRAKAQRRQRAQERL
jgi:carbon monoxide dehydrogenase subunit G